MNCSSLLRIAQVRGIRFCFVPSLFLGAVFGSDVVLQLLPSAKSGTTITISARETPHSDALDLFIEGISHPSSSHAIVSAGGKLDDFVEKVASQESLKGIVQILETFVEAMDQVAKIHPIINVAWKVVHALYQIPKNQLDRDDKIVRLLAQIRDLYVTLRTLEDVEKAPELEDIIEAILQQTIECVLFIREYVGSGFGKRVLHQTLSSTDSKIKEFEVAFRDLKDSFRNRSLVHITLVTTRVSGRVNKIYLMGQLSPVEMETFDLPRCHPGTRSSEIQLITEWVMDSSADQRILWLPGLAGFGKSTLSATLADSFSGLRRLGAFLFFDRDVKERSTPSRVIKTLAYQLALFDHRVAEKVSALIDESPFLVQSHVRNQFAQLIVKPLCSIEGLDDDGPLVIILDALDECGDAKSRRPLLAALADESQRLPPCIRIIITSRPSDDIIRVFEDRPHIKCHRLEITSENSKDVKAFLKHSMRCIAQSNKHLMLAPDWPGCPVLRVLTTRAGGLFIWADTAVRYMDDGMNPVHCLDVLVNGMTPKDGVNSLSQLYVTALSSSQKWEDDEFCMSFSKLFGAILVAKSPLPPSVMDTLLGLPPHWSLQMTLYFKAVLIEEPTGAIRIIHPSFYDFLTSQAQAGSPWFIDAPLHNKHMAFHCLTLLSHTLKENMCSLSPSLGLPAMPIVALEVSYSCLSWIPHACATVTDVQSLGEHVYQFLHLHLLHWLEILSLLKQSRETLYMLYQLQLWLNAYIPEHAILCNLVDESIKFCRHFAAVIEQHPLAVYQVALPFSPPESIIYDIFHKDGHHPTVFGNPFKSWPPSLLILAQSNKPCSVAFSPTLMRVATGTYDSTLCLWDAVAGSVVFGPLKMQGTGIHSVAFTSDGSKLLSATDEAICVWDTVNGTLVFDQLQGMEGPMWAASFSLDGSKIVSGSTFNGDIHVWDIETGSLVLGPLHHEGLVHSISFSPDGSKLVTGSSNHTICVWCASTGIPAFPPLQGHEGPVSSVKFSPDGTRIASGSHDRSVCVWSTSTGALMQGPLLGAFYDAICTVSFSSDGSKIASGSQDSTVCVWDVAAHLESPPSNRKHGNHIWAVAISPDGQKIASGSDNGRMCIWDVATGTLAVEPSSNQQLSVQSMAFSPSGQHVVSGTLNNTIFLWNTITGSSILGPLKGKNGLSVAAVAFSPDGLRVVSGSNYICMWDATAGTLISSHGPTDDCYSVVFSPDGLKVALALLGEKGTSICIMDGLSGMNIEQFSLFPSPNQLDLCLPALGLCAAALQKTNDAQECFNYFIQATGIPMFDHIRAFSISSGNIAVGLLDGRVLFMHFPPSHLLHYS
ncbi:hypothetical protein BOTBODRAFT_119418 [Botryobasidium botryosum FD-172 SS1]|uniref:NACHT domain-containing protein n=1 Tax=Botryobasidium botryosum (strain FD-172 SS1) TaxID=930990 RepID=A0A067LZS5_BOTB1|nr:hypothetical protein BOTBODRAFT_119418 [Botryobasidium botryosum FD-172 SS1]